MSIDNRFAKIVSYLKIQFDPKVAWEEFKDNDGWIFVLLSLTFYCLAFAYGR